jgi:hypothetical protein
MLVIAWQALMSRLMRTCCSWIRSASTQADFPHTSASCEALMWWCVHFVLHDTLSVSLTMSLQALGPAHRIGLARQRPDPADHLAGAARAVVDALQGACMASGMSGPCAIEPATAAVSAAGDGRQRLVDFVRDRRGELAQEW